MTNLWVDDERDAPPDWLWTTTNAGAITALSNIRVEHLSLDYVLGRGQYTSEIMKWLYEHPERWPTGSIVCHSSSIDAQHLIERMVADFAPGAQP